MKINCAHIREDNVDKNIKLVSIGLLFEKSVISTTQLLYRRKSFRKKQNPE